MSAFWRAATILERLFASRGTAVRALDAIAGGAVTGAVVLFWFADVVVTTPAFPPDAHLGLSLDLAVNEAMCNRAGRLSNTFSPAAYLNGHPESIAEPIRALIDRAISIDAYCRTVAVPYVNTENSLLLMMRAALACGVKTVANLGQVFGAARVLLLVFAAAALTFAGVSPAFVMIATLASCAVLRELEPYQYALYPFLFVVPLSIIAFYAAALVVTRRRPAMLWPLSGIAGLWTGIGVNVRTSHTPSYVLLFGLYIWATLGWARAQPQARRAALVRLGEAAAAFAIGWLAFHVFFIRPLQTQARDVPTIAYHPIAHPIVLGLALPPNPLSAREGLAWNDGVGLTIARRVDPVAQYLSPEYEQALWRYYGGLWRAYPTEMLSIYRAKLRMAGDGVVQAVAALLPRRFLPSLILMVAPSTGGQLLAIALATAAVACWAGARSGWPVFLPLAMLSVAAAMVVVEAAATLPTFYIFYQSVLLLYLVLIPVIVAQALVDGIQSFARVRGGQHR